MTSVIPDPDHENTYLIGSGTEPIFGAQVGTVVIENVHTPDRCAGHHCVIHNPSDHHMRGWPLNWRDDWGIMERICPHGIGHPDPDDIGDGVHSCDGCCRS